MKTIAEKKANPYKPRTIEKAVKDVDLQKRVVTGIFNSYFYIDSDLDMLMPGCASKSIQERGVNSTKGNKIKHLKDHDWSKNIARIDVLDERDVTINGRKVSGIYHESFYPNTQDSTDMLIKIQEGMYDARSIGFQYVDIELLEKGSDNYEKIIPMAINPEVAEETGYFYVVREIKLWEGSDVSFGANQLTPMLDVKGVTKEMIQEQLFQKLDICNRLARNGNLSDEGFHSLDMEIKQIKSYITSLIEQKPLKGDANKSRREHSTFKKDDNFFKQLSRKL